MSGLGARPDLSRAGRDGDPKESPDPGGSQLPLVVHNKVGELGRLGSAVLGVLQSRSTMVSDIVELPFESQVSLVLTDSFGRKRDYRLSIALALVGCDYAVQIPHDVQAVDWIFENSIKPLRTQVKKWSHGRMLLGSGKLKEMFRRQPHAGAVNKSNVYFSEVFPQLRQAYPAYAQLVVELLDHMEGLTDDQACAVVLYGYGTAYFSRESFTRSLRLVLDPVGSKHLNSALKSLGLNGCIQGAVLCEAICLQGRGTTDIDLVVEASARVGKKGASQAVACDLDLLRKVVREILTEEIDVSKVEYTTTEDAWSRRWLSCVNGAHSRLLERAEAEWAVPVKGQIHKRVAAESWTRNPLDHWSGKVYVSASKKLENGKTRLLLATDTVSYFNFDYFLRPIERAWKGIRVLLDPGSLGMYGMSEKVRGLAKRPVYLMADYDDFNSQHTLEAQAIVVEEAAILSGFDRDRTAMLVNSFWDTTLSAEGKLLGKLGGTLCSGHRGTTFLNSVLNAAYVKLSVGDVWHSMRSLHVGDDVVAALEGYGMAGWILDRMREKGFRLNPVKQSVGQYTAEFLRLAIRPDFSVGYLARAVGTCVSGNWTNDKSLDSSQYLVNILNNVTAMENRSCRTASFARLLTRPAAKRCGIGRKVMAKLLNSTMALGEGPIFRGTNIVQQATLSPDAGLDLDLSGVDSFATDAFLSHHVSLVEREVLEETGISVRNSMLEASYAKSLFAAPDIERYFKPKLTVRGVVIGRGSATVEEVKSIPLRKGLLTEYPILHMVKDRLTSRMLRTIMSRLGFKVRVDDAYAAAWGDSPHCVKIVGILPYSEAASLSRRTDVGVIYVSKNVYM